MKVSHLDWRVGYLECWDSNTFIRSIEQMPLYYVGTYPYIIQIYQNIEVMDKIRDDVE